MPNITFNNNDLACYNHSYFYEQKSKTSNLPQYIYLQPIHSRERERKRETDSYSHDELFPKS